MTAAISSVQTPAWSILYQGVNITADVSPMLLELEYTDVVSAESGDASITLEDRDRKWQGAWMPSRGDLVAMSIGYQGGAMLNCGNFQVDQIELAGPPDSLRLRLIHTYITPAIRTERSLPYENMSVLQIAQAVAARNNLTVVAAPAALSTVYQRVTQAQEHDLGFLTRLANALGYDFTIRGSQMTFYARSAIEAQAPALTIARSSVTRFQFTTKSARTYKNASATYFNPATKSLVSGTSDGSAPTGDTLRIVRRLENGQQATAHAQAELHRLNLTQATARLTAPGIPAAVAGSVAAISGFSSWDGNYVINKAGHRINRSGGYSTELELASAASSS